MQSRIRWTAGVGQSYFYLYFYLYVPLHWWVMQVAYILSLRRTVARRRNRGPFWNHARYRRPIVFSTLAYPIPFCPFLTDSIPPFALFLSIRHSSGARNIRDHWRSFPECRYSSSNMILLKKYEAPARTPPTTSSSSETSSLPL